MLRTRGWLLLLGLASSSCSLETVKAGGACQRSTQCAEGLACVNGRCSQDLSSIAATNTVPMYGGGSGGAPVAGGSGPEANGGAPAGEAGAAGERAGDGAQP
jgi:hypothetical protein